MSASAKNNYENFELRFFYFRCFGWKIFWNLTSLRSGVHTPLFSVQHVPGHELNGAAATAEKIPKTSFIFFFSILRARKVWWNILDWGVFIWQKAPEAGRSGVDCLERFLINCSQGWKFDLDKNLDFWLTIKIEPIINFKNYEIFLLKSS